MATEGRLLIVDDEREYCVDLKGHELGGIEVLERLQSLSEPPAAIMLSGDDRVSTIVEAMRLGAFHYVDKDNYHPQDLTNLINRAMESWRRARLIAAQQGELGRHQDELICADEAMQAILRQADTVAAAETNVLLSGESGTGKEMIAQRIHRKSAYGGGPFVGINCAAIPDELIESEIFGHVAGAFTGAHARVGKLELASGGTFFLDEVGEANPNLQAKLLRALGERVFERVGENRLRRVECRIIAATSRDLEQAIGDGGFRRDLYYRLNTYRIEIPPLRRRPDDLLPLAEYCLHQVASRNGRHITGFSNAVIERIKRGEWRGNVRELNNFVERAVINCQGGVITLGDMFGPGAEPDPEDICGFETGTLAEAGKAAQESRERTYCINRLVETGGNVTRAAELSGVRRSAFQRKCRELGIDPAAYRAP
jgi:DNA-binding NtrC family response regulator